MLALAQGATSTTGTVAIGAGLTLSGQTLSGQTNNITVTDGVSTLSPLVTLQVTNLDLVSATSPPSVVQKAFIAAGGTLTLPNAPISGNMIVIISLGNDNQVPSLPGTNRVSFDSTGKQLLINTTISSGVNPSISLAFSVAGAIYELSGVSAISQAGANTNTVTGTGPYNTTQTGPISATYAELILFVSMDVSGIPYNILPVGSVVDASGGAQGQVFLRTPNFGPSVSAPTLGYTSTNNPSASFPFGFIGLAGTFSGGVADITPTLPVYASGTLLGGAQTLVQGSGMTLNVSGNSLTIANAANVVAQVGTTTQSVGTLNAGANISFSGAAPNLTIAASTTASANITIKQAGTSIGTVGTINFPAISVAGGVATVNLSDQLDAEFSSTQGAVLYRDASAWKALGTRNGGAGVAEWRGGGKSVLGGAERWWRRLFKIRKRNF